MGVGHFDSSDRNEAILTIDPEYVDGQLPRPVALLWNVANQRYELQALLSHNPALVPRHGAWAVGDTVYRTISVRLAGGGAIHNVGGAPFLAIARSRIAAAYPVNKTCNGCSGTWQFKTYCIDFETPALSGEETNEYTKNRAKNYLTFVSVNDEESSIGARLHEALRRGYCE